jgi:DNA-binding FadR family transcriptional regulator
MIVRAAHNPVMSRMLSAVYDLIREYQYFFDTPTSVESAVNFHKLIVSAIKARNADAARALMYQHIENAENELLTVLKERKPQWNS